VNAGERSNAIERYRQGPAALRAAWESSPPDARQWRPRPGDWTVHEIVAHCADSEVNAYTRIRMLMAEQNPPIVGYDQDVWASRFDYHARPVDSALALVEATRAHTSELLTVFTDEDWTRAGIHSERGPYSAEDWLLDYSEHLHEHVRQIEVLVSAWAARASTP